MIDEKLSKLIERLKSSLGDRLESVVLYGSAAMNDWQQESSDLNVLCVLTQISRRELGSCEPIFQWWKQQGNPAPLLLTAEEVRTATDCFPMEFHDMQEHRRILYGVDIIDGLIIDESFYRAQVEHELRAKQIRLRQKAAEVLSKPDKLTRLLVDSLSTFCVLGRHALILSGHEPRYQKLEILKALEKAMNRDLNASNAILAIRSSAKPGTAADVDALFDRYLDEMGSLVRFVDQLARENQSAKLQRTSRDEKGTDYS